MISENGALLIYNIVLMYATAWWLWTFYKMMGRSELPEGMSQK